ncbi:MAG: acyltransferase [Deltaproteobacteria bacterium]|nr:acyltransferase [Deltaproteobacteria bacterium]
MSGDAKPGRLAAIDALRGIAVLAVLVSHLPFSGAARPAEHDRVPVSLFPEWLVAVLDHGRFGVHLFLVISGFCIHMAWARKPDDADLDFLSFWRRRLHRLYPPYLATLLLSLLGLYVLHGVLGGATGGIATKLGYASSTQLAVDLVLLLLLAQNLNGASHRIGNGPFWTLALEEQLYMLYFPLLWLRRRLGWSVAILAIAVTTIAWRAAACLFPVSWQDALLLVGPSRWFEWALGALAVEAYLGRVSLPSWTRSGLVGLGVLVLAVTAFNVPRLGVPIFAVVPYGDALFGVGLFVLVNYACSVRWNEGTRVSHVSRFFGWVGSFSYSLYLTHQIAIVAAKQVGLRIGFGAGGILILRIVLPIAGAWLFYQTVERRFLNASRARGGDRGTANRVIAEGSVPDAPSLASSSKGAPS